jgi:hypothetical protein
MNRRAILSRMLLACGMSALALAGCQKPEPAQPDRPRLAPGVTMQDVSFFSAA